VTGKEQNVGQQDRIGYPFNGYNVPQKRECKPQRGRRTPQQPPSDAVMDFVGPVLQGEGNDLKDIDDAQYDGRGVIIHVYRSHL